MYIAKKIVQTLVILEAFMYCQVEYRRFFIMNLFENMSEICYDTCTISLTYALV